MEVTDPALKLIGKGLFFGVLPLQYATHNSLCMQTYSRAVLRTSSPFKFQSKF